MKARVTGAKQWFEEAQLGQTELIKKLFEASRYGITGSIPAGPDDPELPLRWQTVQIEVTRRDKACQALITQIDGGNQPDHKIELLIEAMQALFGNSFIVLPTFTPAGVTADSFSNALKQDSLLAGLGEERVRLWWQQAVCVRPPLAELENALMMIEAWAQPTGAKPLGLKVAQLLDRAANRWLALDRDERGAYYDTTRDRGAVSIVAAIANVAGQQGSAKIAGLKLDQWNEFMPEGRVNTNIALHYNGPNSQAPQAVLLAVPGKGVGGEWSPNELAQILYDTLDLAQVRTVDLDAMRKGGDIDNELFAGEMLPGLMLPIDGSSPGWAGETMKGIFDEFMELIWPEKCAQFQDINDPVNNEVVLENSVRIFELADNAAVHGGWAHNVVKYVLSTGNKRTFGIELPFGSSQVRFEFAWGYVASVAVKDFKEKVKIKITTETGEFTIDSSQFGCERQKDSFPYFNHFLPIFAITIPAQTTEGTPSMDIRIKSVSMDLGSDETELPANLKNSEILIQAVCYRATCSDIIMDFYWDDGIVSGRATLGDGIVVSGLGEDACLMRTVPNTQSRTFLSIGHTDSIALKLLVPCSEIRLEFSWLNGAGAITPDDVVQLTGDVMKLISDKLISVEVDDGTLITPLTPLLCPTLMLPHDHPADLLAGRPRFALFALQVRYAKITKLVVNISQQMIPVKFQGFLLGRVYYVAE